jgi:hypothetical protein
MANGPGGMPYVLARKNSIFRNVEAIGTNKEHQLKALKRLIDREPLWTAPRVANNAAGQVVQTNVDHVRDHWFGSPKVETVNGKSTVKAGADQSYPLSTNRTTTGWWKGWQGDAHEIVSETMQRAFQISLGVDDPKNPPSTSQVKQCWPISVIWMCGAPMFQGFVSWDKVGNEGHVTVILATPAPNEDPMLVDGVGANDPQFNRNLAKGVVVIGHENCDLMQLQGPDYVQVTDPMLVNNQMGNIAPVPANANNPQPFYRTSNGKVIARMEP